MMLRLVRDDESEASAVACAKCGRPVEHEREVYAVPTCYACLPPPRPLPVAPLAKHWAAASAVMAECPEVWLGLPLDKLAEKREQLARKLAEVLP